ncbi:hypothetical protein OG417_50955 [Actinoallomurus sp. NBC_01490]|uniref:hypothetical protein n=1 Tax=Actinoallomurus sp. NBC_01490 TaxID=2903557 RepID=UPI002E3169F5|nr:hypothetical protein [Actinoallomurus sp. NBC_01490]
MTPTTGPAPATMLTDTVHAYLEELDQAARVALIERDTARLAARAHMLGGYAPVGSTHAAEGARNSPSHVLWHRRHEDLAEAVRRAERQVGLVACWYARAALVACRAVLAGQTITGRELEAVTPRSCPDHSVGEEGQATGSASRPQCRPDLPEIGALDTGYDNLDRPVRAAQKALQAASPAAVSELLVEWATAVTHAATYGRSIAYGHPQPDMAD